jgi:phenylacetate-CoA ligase
LLRYRTRDLTRLLPGTARPGMRRMEKITGRTDDMMIVRGMNVFPTQIEEQILTVEGLTPHYLCVLTRPGRMDELTVQVEAAPDLADNPEAAAAELSRRIKDRVGITAAVEILHPHALERSLGKAKRISDRR